MQSQPRTRLNLPLIQIRIGSRAALRPHDHPHFQNRLDAFWMIYDACRRPLRNELESFQSYRITRKRRLLHGK